jgi:hypothetical protein
MSCPSILSKGAKCVLIALACVGSIPIHGGEASERQKPMLFLLPEPHIERLSSTQYVVTCKSGRKETITLKGSPESADAAGPKNPYVLSRARELCWQGAHRLN